MSFVNVHYDHRSSTMHVWECIKGERFYDKVIWVPYVYIKTDSKNSPVRTIDGIPVIRKDFNSYHDYYEFCKGRDDIYENNVKPEIQFLPERYHKIPDDELEVAKLRMYTLDIEVHAERGFPDANLAEWPITLISIKDSITKRTRTFGLKEYTGDWDIDYVHCKNEIELLESFINYVYMNPPDVYTGWYIWSFDLPYIINRTKNLLGDRDNTINKLSPINIVRTWTSKKYNEMNIDIAGVHILDYIDVYKWYSPNRLESYKLDFVAKAELEKGKLDYSEFTDLRELYEKDWNKYVEYNVIDVKRVDELEDKLGYIKLIQALSLLTKCPMKFYQTMTSLIEGALITHFRRNNLCAPTFLGGHQESFTAAHVKEPHKGMFAWVIDIDITSSYPSHIITLNMSNETYFGRILDLTEYQIIECMRSRRFTPFSMSKDGMIKKFQGDSLKKFNAALNKGLFAIAPCGSIFITTKDGVIAAVERNIFYKRKEVKGKMHVLRQKAADEANEKEKFSLKERAQELFALQWAIKILLNAMFGITSVPYSRYFNKNLSEAITSCGRHTIKQGERFVNEYFKDFGMNEDMVCYIDTDSLFIKMGRFLEHIDKDWNKKNDEEKTEIILKESRKIEQYVDRRIFNETQLVDYNSQVKDFKIQFKQEIIAKNALFCKKKKYAYWMVNKEGVPTDKLSVTGLEIVRSDSAEGIRVRLKHIYELIMKNATDSELIKTIQKYKKELKQIPPEEIAANVSVNNIEQYIGSGIPAKGTPWHVRGVHNYRKLLKELNIVDEYEDIYEGNKGKIVYIKDNKFNIEMITFTRWPKEFDQFFEIDYEKMIDKFFINKISFLLEPMGKEHLLTSTTSQNTLDLFFS